VWNPALRFNGAVRQPLDQVQHFACHCETHETLSEDCFLGFAHDNRSHRKVTIGDLQNRFAALSVRLPRQEDVALPLIFLNACGTSAIDPGGVSSFPALFVEENGNRGFIGTETRMPDKFAAAFSQAFYTHLLEGYPLGEAIHAAKWNLLEKQNNPMGIFYTVYANPDTRVRKPAKVKTF